MRNNKIKKERTNGFQQQHCRDLPLQKPHFQFFVAETLISLRKNKKERTEKRVKRSFSKGVFGCKGLGRTALAGALDGDEANGAKKKSKIMAIITPNVSTSISFSLSLLTFSRRIFF